MPRAKKVVDNVSGCQRTADDDASFDVSSEGDKPNKRAVFAAHYGKGLVEEYADDLYAIAAIAATQLTVTPHDSNEIIDSRIDRALFIAGKLLAKAKDV